MKHLLTTLAACALAFPVAAQEAASACETLAERLIGIASEMADDYSLSPDEEASLIAEISGDLDGDDLIDCAGMLQMSDGQLALLFIGTSGS